MATEINIESKMTAAEVRAHRFWAEDLEGLSLEQQIRSVELSELAAEVKRSSADGTAHAEVVALVDEVRQRRQARG